MVFPLNLSSLDTRLPGTSKRINMSWGYVSHRVGKYLRGLLIDDFVALMSDKLILRRHIYNYSAQCIPVAM